MADPEVHTEALSGEMHVKTGHAQPHSRAQPGLAPVQRGAAGGSPSFTGPCAVVLACCLMSMHGRARNYQNMEV